MKIEEAIQAIKNEIICVSRQTAEGCDRNCAECDLALTDETINSAYDMAISALRAQQEAEKNEPRQMISKPVWCEDGSCWASLRNLTMLAEQNVPLTREELQKMHGKRVWVEFYPDPGEEQSSFWAHVSVDPNDGEIFLRNDWGGASAYEEVRSDVKAIYRHPPKEAPNV